MKATAQLIAVICVIAFISSCQKTVNPVIPPPPPAVTYDVDAKRFIDSTLITDTTQRRAISNFVIQLKDSSLWSTFLAIYPMLGGTANSTKWNLKDPRNLDAAYRLTFTGNPVFANTGVTFPSPNDYGDTHLTDSAIGGYNNASISYYSRTQNANSGYDMGCTDHMSPYNELSNYSNALDNTEWFGFSFPIAAPITTGLFILSSTANQVTRYRNGAMVKQRGAPPVRSYTNMTILIGTSRSDRAGQKECALATIGTGLTDAQALTLYNIVQKFQTAFGRQIN